MDQKAIALAAAKALDAKRGKDIVVLKVDEMTVITDYMVIATGRSVPQVKALAENVEEEPITPEQIAMAAAENHK